jgi:hypothetical protein
MNVILFAFLKKHMIDNLKYLLSISYGIFCLFFDIMMRVKKGAVVVNNN